MSLRVQKFGGSSVADAERMRVAAARVAAALDAGDQVVVVVSARGGTTDKLLALANEVSGAEPRAARNREMDALLATGEQQSAALMALVLQGTGHSALSLTGWQAGILTDHAHQAARVTSAAVDRIRDALAQGLTPVVTGFQGIAPGGDITTLGRGGSDATAAVLAAALSADDCEIYSDVDGVLTADPRMVPSAERLPEISYEEMLEMARLGAKVLQHRAVGYAQEHGVVLEARSTFREGSGTRVGPSAGESERPITGVSLDRDAAKLAVRGVPDTPGTAAQLLGALAAHEINVDMIVQTVSAERRTNLAFTVRQTDLPAARQICLHGPLGSGPEDIVAEPDMAKLSVVGAGMITRPGVAAKVLAALAGAGVNIELMSTSEISISCLVHADRGAAAVRAVHEAFFGRREHDPSQRTDS